MPNQDEKRTTEDAVMIYRAASDHDDSVRPEGSETLYYHQHDPCTCGHRTSIEVLKLTDGGLSINVSVSKCPRCRRLGLSLVASLLPYVRTPVAEAVRGFLQKEDPSFLAKSDQSDA